MKLTTLLFDEKKHLSFEVFPPKTEDTFESVRTAIEEIAALKPDYMSVTYKADGSTCEYSASIAQDILSCGVTPLAHITCLSSDKKRISRHVERFRAAGVENILALRGDDPGTLGDGGYRYASELIYDLKSEGNFCIGAACYPEGHPESASQKEDIRHLKEKVDAGCDFLTTQMFFDNNILYNFLYKIREAGITVPVVAGIMPVTAAGQIKRICALSGTRLPSRFCQIIDCFGSDPAAMKQAGVAYATEQAVDLYANGVNMVHIYSMNKPDVAAKIQNNLSSIIGK